MHVSEQKRQQIIAKVVAIVESFLDAYGASEAPESQLYVAEHRALDCARRIGRVVLQAEVDALGSGHCGQWHEDEDGVRRKFNRYAPKSYETVVGPITIQRALYHQKGARPACLCPIDAVLGVSSGGYSRGLEEVIALAATTDVYRQGLRLIHRLTGVNVSVHKAERTVAAWGAEAKKKVRTAAEQPETLRARVAATQPIQGLRMCVTTDGTSVQTTERWRDAKLVAAYAFDAAGQKVGGAEYAGTLNYQDDYPLLLWALMERTKASRAETLVWLGDGAHWVWNQQATVAPHAVAIVDFFHAADRLWQVGRALYRGVGDQRKARAWSKRWIGKLYKGQVTAIVRTLAQWRERLGLPPKDALEDDPRQVVSSAHTYFGHNVRRMNYPEYRAQGYPIGSGVIESACRHIVGLRMKRTASMAWSEANAEAMLQLRCLSEGDAWDTFWGIDTLRPYTNHKVA